jgi:hypothetical protein
LSRVVTVSSDIKQRIFSCASQRFIEGPAAREPTTGWTWREKLRGGPASLAAATLQRRVGPSLVDRRSEQPENVRYLMSLVGHLNIMDRNPPTIAAGSQESVQLISDAGRY